MSAQLAVERDRGANGCFDGLRIGQELGGETGGVAAITGIVGAVEAAGDGEGVGHARQV